MSENKLYYYTTIDKLALILDSKAIRFTRLDLFDDMQEIEPFDECNPLRYIFASCHTKDGRENIPLWKMYSSMENGVRIEFDKNTIFTPKTVTINVPHTQLPFDISTINTSSLLPEQIINSDYWAMPISFNTDLSKKKCQHICYKDVIYNDNFCEIYKNKLSVIDKPNGKGGTRREGSFCPTDFGYYKSEYWKFQNESRFLIYTSPFLKTYSVVNDMLSGQKELETKYIDVKLSDNCFDNTILRLSPNANKSARLIVEALAKDFPNIHIEDSELKDTIRDAK